MRATAWGVDKTGLSNLLSVEILGHATWIKASISFRFLSLSFVISVNAMRWTILPALSYSFLNLREVNLEIWPSFNPTITPKVSASTAL